MRTPRFKTIKQQFRKRAIRSCWCTLLMLFNFPLLAPASLSAQFTPEKQYAAGLIAAHKMNVDSWRQADFLMQVVQHSTGTSWDSDKPRGEDGDFSIDRVEEFLYRVKFDASQNRILAIASSRDDYLIRDKKGEIVDSKISPSTSPKTDRFFGTPTSPELRKLRIPDLQMAGLFGVEFTLGPANLQQEKNWVKLFSADGISSVKDLDSDILEIDYEFDYAGVSQPQRIRKFEIDQNTFTPRAVRLFNIDQTSGVARLAHSHEIEWKKTDSGLFVPQKLKQQHRQLSFVDRQKFLTDIETNVVIHWFSVNQEMDDALLKSALEDRDAKPKQFQQYKAELRELINPEKTKATYILENRLVAELLE